MNRLFVFGIDLPVVEMFLISSIITFILLILIALLFRRIIEFNKKLDQILKEEHIVKKELDQTKDDLDQTRAEEDEQLKLIKVVVKELGAVESIIKIGDKEIDYMKKLVDELNGLSTMKVREGRYIKKMDSLVERFYAFSDRYHKHLEKLSNVHKLISTHYNIKKSTKKASNKKKK